MFDLCQDARRNRPNEICGFILRDGGTWRQSKMVNVAIGDHEFAMDPQDTIDVFERYGRQIVGVYHSHPEGTEVPSQTDVDYAPIGFRYWIVTPDCVLEWSMGADGGPKEISRQARSS